MISNDLEHKKLFVFDHLSSLSVKYCAYVVFYVCSREILDTFSLVFYGLLSNFALLNRIFCFGIKALSITTRSTKQTQFHLLISSYHKG